MKRLIRKADDDIIKSRSSILSESAKNGYVLCTNINNIITNIHWETVLRKIVFGDRQEQVEFGNLLAQTLNALHNDWQTIKRERDKQVEFLKSISHRDGMFQAIASSFKNEDKDKMLDSMKDFAQEIRKFLAEEQLGVIRDWQPSSIGPKKQLEEAMRPLYDKFTKLSNSIINTVSSYLLTIMEKFNICVMIYNHQFAK